MELSNRENWRSINGYLNYEVSDVGRIRNVNTGKILKATINTRGYFYISLCDNGKIKKHQVHRIVAQEFFETSDNKTIVDHIDGNKLNNCVSNLRWASNSENGMNRKPQRNKFSKYKGVYFNKHHNKWCARIMSNDKRKHLGYYDDEKEAAAKYNEAAIEYFCEFAHLNKIE